MGPRSEAERHQLLVEWSGAPREYPRDLCLHHIVEAQADRAPDAVAYVCCGQPLRYGDLERRANRLARLLRRRGVGPDVPAGLYMERCLDLMVCLVAVLKAGGALLYLDPDDPPDRSAFMLEDTGARLVLTHGGLAARLSGAAETMMLLDELDLSVESDARPDSGVRGDNLAYVIYTSGSTGRPKGVMRTHFMCTNRLLWELDRYGFTDSDSHLVKSPISARECFLLALVGGRGVLAEPGGHQDSAYMVRLIAEQGISYLSVVPSMLQVLLREPGIGSCGLRRVSCGGEPLPQDLQNRFFSRVDGELYCAYTLTEADYVASRHCRPSAPGGLPSLGRPTDMRVYLLDEEGRPVAAGDPGEIYTGGPGLARGYVRRPDLTAERFLPDPFGGEPGGRLYRTGDLARFRWDGTLEYLGRADHQVKIRGLRIEPGEIEAVTLQNPAVAEAVITVREDTPGDRRLVLYVVGSGPSPLATSELRAFLSERLPPYMLPSSIVVLERMPQLLSGKVDRAALPAPTAERPDLPSPYVPPRTATERLVAGLWQELLRVREVGIDDDFFALGGHSLLLAMVRDRLEEALGREIPVATLFHHPSIRALAAHLDGGAETTLRLEASRDRAEHRRQGLQGRRMPRRLK